jgi:hypothetical protein
MISSYIYLYHTGETFNIPVTPENLANSYQSKFSLEEIMNRTAPKASFSGSGPRTLQVNLTIHSQLYALDNPDQPDLTKGLIKALCACSYPEFDASSYKITPPRVLIKFGEACTIRGVITSGVSCTYSGPWLKDGTMAIATISFTVTELDQLSASFIQEFGANIPIPTDFERRTIW